MRGRRIFLVIILILLFSSSFVQAKDDEPEGPGPWSIRNIKVEAIKK